MRPSDSRHLKAEFKTILNIRTVYEPALDSPDGTGGWVLADIHNRILCSRP